MNFWFALVIAGFLVVALLVWLGISIISPEIGLILLASLAFGIFAFRLLSTYILVIAIADTFRERGNIENLQKIAQKSGKSEEELKRIPLSTALTLTIAALEPYRYTYYFGFVIVLLFALAVNSLPIFADLKILMEAIFWGTALTTFIVWAFETFAEASISEVAELEEKQNPTHSGN